MVTTVGRSVNQAGELRSARVESLRAIAALGVLVGHVFGTAHHFGASAYRGFWHRVVLGGGFGVFVFFVLSGYLLFLPFARSWLGDAGPVDLGRYALNRALRILPLYYVAALVLLWVQRWPLSDWWRFAVFAEDLSHRTVGRVDGPMWSLVVEIEFYAMLPLLAAALVAFGQRSLSGTSMALGALALVALFARLGLVDHSGPVDPLWQYSFPANFWFFTPGMGLALLRLALERHPPAWKRRLAGSGDAWLLASVPLWAVVFWRYNLGWLAAPASFLVVASCVLPLRAGPVVRLIGNRPLAALGVASYSLYLWHLPIVTWVAGLGWAPASTWGLLAVLVPGCCLVALASYAVVEAPFLRLRRRWVPAPRRAGGPDRRN